MAAAERLVELGASAANLMALSRRVAMSDNATANCYSLAKDNQRMAARLSLRKRLQPLIFSQKSDSYINVKVELGEGGKVSLKVISERVEAYKQKERVTYNEVRHKYVSAKLLFVCH